MSQVLFNYPGMTAVQGNMVSHATTIDVLGQNVKSEQSALSATWIGGTGMTVQQWIAQWNSALDEAVQGLRSMATAYEDSKNQMLARDQTEGSKWG